MDYINFVIMSPLACELTFFDVESRKPEPLVNSSKPYRQRYGSKETALANMDSLMKL